MHITVDGYGGSADALADKSVISAFLDAYPEKIGMSKIAQPHITAYHAENPEDSGISGFVLIAESHISIHTFPRRRFAWVDVFSCKGFDSDIALDFVKQTFGMEHMEVRRLDRGFEFPHSVPSAAVMAGEERDEVRSGFAESKQGA